MPSLTEQNIRKQLGQKIKEYRNLSKLTQAELSSKMQVTQTYLGHVEQGLKTPSLSFLIKVATKLKIKISELFVE